MNKDQAGTSNWHDLTWRVTPDLLGICSPSGRFEATNPAWQKALGYSAAEIESRHLMSFVHPDDRPSTEQAFVEIQQGKPILQFENRYRHKDGGYRWLSWNCVPEGDRYLCSGRDITEAKRNAASLKSSEEEALLREQFIAVLGHDLRNPLAAVRAGLNMLERETLSERGQMVIAESEKSVHRMFALIYDLMDFARARLGSGLSLDFGESCDIKAALDNITGEIVAAHPEARIETDIAVDGKIRCDIARICQMTSNLVANAVTHGGSEAIRLRARGNAEFLSISVHNGGAPIPEAIRPHLFEPFVREEARPSQEGLGLGLYICAQIARAHGGDLKVASDENETVFTFTMGDPAKAGLVGWS